jgi:hypothetical protein
MANRRHLKLLNSGDWNAWREQSPRARPDLSGADLALCDLMQQNLSKANLQGADLAGAFLNNAWLHGADLRKAILSNADLEVALASGSNLSGAKLDGARLRGTFLLHTKLRKADLRGADLVGANLFRADLTGADLSGANLNGANMVETLVEGATFDGCRVYGTSIWGLRGTPKSQVDLIFTPVTEPPITVDNLQVAQFVYLIRNNPEIRNVIDTIGKKGVLILGRFSQERKAVLDAIREKLRQMGYIPMVFDFERPTDRDFTETVLTLSGMCLFIIADITNPKSSPLELQATVPNYMVPFATIIQTGEKPFSMFKDLWNKHEGWVLKPVSYESEADLLMNLHKLVARALEMQIKLVKLKARELEVTPISEI